MANAWHLLRKADLLPERAHATPATPGGTSCSAVDEPAVGRAGGLEDRLGERRMRMDRAGDLRVAALQIPGDDELLDQVGGLRRDDVRAEDLAVAAVADDLHHAAAIAVDGRRADRAHRHFADDHLMPGLLGLLLGQPEARDLRRAERHSRDE